MASGRRIRPGNGGRIGGLPKEGLSDPGEPKRDALSSCVELQGSGALRPWPGSRGREAVASVSFFLSVVSLIAIGIERSADHRTRSARWKTVDGMTP